jgi:hypothetical protein
MTLEKRKELPLFPANVAFEQIRNIENLFAQSGPLRQFLHALAQVYMIAQQIIEQRRAFRYSGSDCRKQDFLFGAEVRTEFLRQKATELGRPRPEFRCTRRFDLAERLFTALKRKRQAMMMIMGQAN